jgi:hypothetical protein
LTKWRRISPLKTKRPSSKNIRMVGKVPELVQWLAMLRAEDRRHEFFPPRFPRVIPLR